MVCNHDSNYCRYFIAHINETCVNTTAAVSVTCIVLVNEIVCNHDSN